MPSSNPNSISRSRSRSRSLSSTSNSSSTRPDSTKRGSTKRGSTRPDSTRRGATRPRQKTSKRSSPTPRRTSRRTTKKPNFLSQEDVPTRSKPRKGKFPKVKLTSSKLRPIKKFIQIKKREGLDELSRLASIMPRAGSIQDEINFYLKKNPELYNDIAQFRFINFLTTTWKDAQIHNYEVDSDDFPIKKEIIKKYLIDESYSVSYARTILGNYTTLLRNENRQESTRDYNNVASKIGIDCLKNFRGDKHKFCFCCGKPIKTKDSDDNLTPIEVQCDHVIPVNTMLVTVTNDTVHKDLVFIHSTCNNKKGEMNIWDTYKEIGRKKGIFGNMVDSSITDEQENENIKKCQDKFISIITSMKLRPVVDIKSRQDAMTELNNILQYKFKEYFDLYMDTGKAANILVKLKNTS